MAVQVRRASSFAPAPALGMAAFRLRSRQNIVVKAEKCLIVNTKGGGHAFIGLHLANQLLSAGHDVTILNDGDQGKLQHKGPFSQYKSLAGKGARIVWGEPSRPTSYVRGTFDVVYDNNGKDIESCKPLIDAFAGKVKNYVFVSSAGAYKADTIQPIHIEGDARKESAGHVEVERYMKAARVPYTVFQPLYIYGPNTAKDCEQWFIDRVIRDRPVPIPQPGIQLVTLTHVDDVASMLAAVPGNRLVIGQHYNVCSDRTVTFQGIVKAIAASLGKEPKIVLYNPEQLGLGKGAKAEGFPFRTTHFFASADKAKLHLGWQPKHNFLSDVPDLVAAYKSSGRTLKDIDFSIDEKIFAALNGSTGSNGASNGGRFSSTSSGVSDAVGSRFAKYSSKSYTSPSAETVQPSSSSSGGGRFSKYL